MNAIERHPQSQGHRTGQGCCSLGDMFPSSDGTCQPSLARGHDSFVESEVCAQSVHACLEALANRLHGYAAFDDGWHPSAYRGSMAVGIPTPAGDQREAKICLEIERAQHFDDQLGERPLLRRMLYQAAEKHRCAWWWLRAEKGEGRSTQGGGGAVARTAGAAGDDVGLRRPGGSRASRSSARAIKTLAVQAWAAHLRQRYPGG